MPFVNFVALALKIRPKISAHLRAFIPFEPKPAQPVVDRLRSFGCVARLIGILDSQDERTAGMTREEPVEERGARAADVEETGRRRGETNANGGSHMAEFELGNQEARKKRPKFID